MKRILILSILIAFTLVTFATTTDAQRRRRRSTRAAPSGKIAVACPTPLNDITDCPDTGCGPSLDPHLNEQKNIRSDDQQAEPMTIQQMRNLPDPVSGFKVGYTREKLKALGEGKKITVVANAIAVRKGGGDATAN